MADEHDDDLARHTAWTLAAAQAFGGASPAMKVPAQNSANEPSTMPTAATDPETAPTTAPRK